MDKFVNALTSNPVIFLLLNTALYLFYALLVGLSALPSAWLIYRGLAKQSPLVLALCFGIGVFLFFITGLLVFAIVERLLTLGFKPGKYSTSSLTFMRWLVYSGVHTLALSLILPFVIGSGFTKIYYKIIGVKLGKDVFINTIGLHDPYLLTVGDNVIIGGKTDITCHTFESGFLTLERINIGSNVLIGANCYIMPGVTVEDNCDIGANSLIRKNKVIAEKSVIMQMPAMHGKELAILMKKSKPSRNKEQIKN
ncbi:hypothetical protein LJB89_03105 [Tyzzerella sp. OttesenSCG-928-J15]|nr:hypothetical protein [Tyzzerella sp. OttesenSCG-928-J15]